MCSTEAVAVSRDGTTYVFCCEGRSLSLSLSLPSAPAPVTTVTPAHRLWYPSEIVCIAVTPSEEWDRGGEGEDAVPVVLAYVALRSGDVFQVAADSLSSLQCSTPAVVSSSLSTPPSPPLFSSLADLLAPLPSPGSISTTARPILNTRRRRSCCGFQIHLLCAVGGGLLLMSGSEEGHTSTCLLMLHANEDDEEGEGGHLWPLVTGGQAPVTAALLLSSSPSSPYHAPWFRAALLAHLLGGEGGGELEATPLLLMGTEDGHLLWLPLPTFLWTFPSVAPSCTPTPPLLSVYFLRRFSQSTITSIRVATTNASRRRGDSDSGDTEKRRVIVLVHEDCSLAFLRASSAEGAFGTHRLLSDCATTLHLPLLCRHRTVDVSEGIVLALTAGGLLVAFVLQQHPAAATFIEQPPTVLSGSNMKRIVSFSLLPPSTTASCSPASAPVGWRLLVRFADCTVIMSPSPPALPVSFSPNSNDMGLAFTRNQWHLRETQERLLIMHALFSSFGSFAPLAPSKAKQQRRKLKQKQKGQKEKGVGQEKSRGPTDEAVAQSIRSLLTNIISANDAKELVLQKQAMLDAEVLASSALVQLLQHQQWPDIYSVHLDISSGKTLMPNLRESVFCGIITISTASMVAMHALQGKTLRAQWRCCVQAPGAAGGGAGGAAVAQSHSSTMSFHPSNPIGQGQGQQQYECQVAVPLQIDVTAPHELSLQVVVNLLSPQLMFSELTAPLRCEVHRGGEGDWRMAHVVDRAGNLQYSVDTSAEQELGGEKDGGGKTSLLFDLSLTTVKKSLAEILLATKGFLPAISEPMLPSGGPHSSITSPDSTESGGLSALRMFRAKNSRRKLSEVLGRRELPQPRQHSLTSYAPCILHNKSLSDALLRQVTETARTVESSVRGSGSVGSSYSFKTTNVLIQSSPPSLNPAAAPAAALDSVKALHHKSNSKLVLALLQADLHSGMLRLLDKGSRGCQHAATSADTDTCLLSQTQSPSPSGPKLPIQFADSDIYALPHELQQAMMECQAIQRKLSRCSAGSDSQQAFQTVTGVCRSGAGSGGCDDFGYSAGDRERITDVHDACEKIWSLYQMVREYGV